MAKSLQSDQDTVWLTRGYEILSHQAQSIMARRLFRVGLAGSAFGNLPRMNLFAAEKQTEFAPPNLLLALQSGWLYTD